MNKYHIQKMRKKAQGGLPLRVIVVSILLLIALVIIGAIFFSGSTGIFGTMVNYFSGRTGTNVLLQWKAKCQSACEKSIVQKDPTNARLVFCTTYTNEKVTTLDGDPKNMGLNQDKWKNDADWDGNGKPDTTQPYFCDEPPLNVICTGIHKCQI